MKCTHCGFTYEEEAVCPICGTPAPYRETVPEEPYFDLNINEAAAVPDTNPQPSAQQEPSAPVSNRSAKGLQIAALCILAFIAAVLLYLAVLGSVAFAWMQSDYAYWYDTWEAPDALRNAIAENRHFQSL